MQRIYDNIGLDQGPSEEKGFRASLFDSQFAPHVKTISFSSPEQFAQTLRTTTALIKGVLPWIKFGLFTGERTANNCCRCDAFFKVLTGAEADYDAGKITALDIALWLQAAGVEAIIGETASSTPEAPRWRVWLPASLEHTGTPDELRTLRQRWVARVNGIVNGKLDGSSFTLSQAFYIGGITGKPLPTVIVTRGRRIDLCDDLDATAIFKNGRSEPSERRQIEEFEKDPSETDDDPRLVAECQHIVQNFAKSCGYGATPTGERAHRLVQWLADLGTRDGLTPSVEMIHDATADDYPNTTAGMIHSMLSRRKDPRGWDVIDAPPELPWEVWAAGLERVGPVETQEMADD
jgi:hypothetical protein